MLSKLDSFRLGCALLCLYLLVNKLQGVRALNISHTQNASISVQTSAIYRSPSGQQLWWFDSTTSTVVVVELPSLSLVNITTWNPKQLPLGRGTFRILNQSSALAIAYTGSISNPGPTMLVQLQLPSFYPTRACVFKDLANGTGVNSMTVEKGGKSLLLVAGEGNTSAIIRSSLNCQTSVLYQAVNPNYFGMAGSVLTPSGELVVPYYFSLGNGTIALFNPESSSTSGPELQLTAIPAAASFYPPSYDSTFIFGSVDSYGRMPRVSFTNIHRVEYVQVPLPPSFNNSLSIPEYVVSSGSHLFVAYNTQMQEFPFSTLLWLGRSQLPHLLSWDTALFSNLTWGFFGVSGSPSMNIAVGDTLYGSYNVYFTGTSTLASVGG